MLFLTPGIELSAETAATIPAPSTTTAVVPAAEPLDDAGETTPEGHDDRETTLTEESEADDIIPPNAEVLRTTGPITPTSVFHDKNPYEQALEELAQARALWAAGHAEAASDTALEAYDDLLDLRRVPGVKRQTILRHAHKAAAIYIEAGIAAIRQFVKRHGSTREAIEEGRARMEDMRDVARSYPELRRMLNSAIDQLLSGRQKEIKNASRNKPVSKSTTK
jgi:hypothetical protein